MWKPSVWVLKNWLSNRTLDIYIYLSVYLVHKVYLYPRIRCYNSFFTGKLTLYQLFLKKLLSCNELCENDLCDVSYVWGNLEEYWYFKEDYVTFQYCPVFDILFERKKFPEIQYLHYSLFNLIPGPLQFIEWFIMVEEGNTTTS